VDGFSKQWLSWSVKLDFFRSTSQRGEREGGGYLSTPLSRVQPLRFSVYSVHSNGGKKINAGMRVRFKPSQTPGLEILNIGLYKPPPPPPLRIEEDFDNNEPLKPPWALPGATVLHGLRPWPVADHFVKKLHCRSRDASPDEPPGPPKRINYHPRVALLPSEKGYRDGRKLLI
jgi:hypothetical protein